MKEFNNKEIYMEDGKRVLEINILPEKNCNFDCIFCPIGRSHNHTDKSKAMENMDECIEKLGEKIEETKPDLVFINSMGEAFVNDKLQEVIDAIHHKKLPVRLLSNGYLYGDEKFAAVAMSCEEVIGELKVTREEDFQRMQRPVEGYTVANHVKYMSEGC